jgi:hypothetical protein
MSSNTFWLADWVDEKGIRTAKAAAKLLAEPRAVRELYERVESRPRQLDPLPDCEGPAILAGAGIDLSGRIDCGEPECIQRRLEELFSHVLHYFDAIVVEGPNLRHAIMRGLKNPGHLPVQLLGYVQIVLLMKEMGAEDLLIFRDKPAFCQEQHIQTLNDAGMGTSLFPLEREPTTA